MIATLPVARSARDGFAERVEWRRADIAEHDADAAEREAPKT